MASGCSAMTESIELTDTTPTVPGSVLLWMVRRATSIRVGEENAPQLLEGRVPRPLEPLTGSSPIRSVSPARVRELQPGPPRCGEELDLDLRRGDAGGVHHVGHLIRSAPRELEQPRVIDGQDPAPDGRVTLRPVRVPEELVGTADSRLHVGVEAEP